MPVNLSAAALMCDKDEILEAKGIEKKLAKTFIKNAASEQFAAICKRSAVIYVIIEKQNKEKGRMVRGGIYNVKKQKTHREKISHSGSVYCEIKQTSHSKKINYLCYNPTVAAGSTKGYEYSFRVKNKKSYMRECTVYFIAGMEDECGNWTNAAAKN